MNSTTINGNLTADPELKFMTSGDAQVRLRVAVNRRWQNKQTQEWEERVSYFTVVAYGTLAENCAKSLERGTRVLVTGRLEYRDYETPDGEKRSVTEIIAEDVAPSLTNATTTVTKAAKPVDNNAYRAAKRTEHYIDEAF